MNDGVPDLTALLAELDVAATPAGGWLIVAAHPDDDVVGATWVLARAPSVTVAYVTDGAPRDPAWRARGEPSGRIAYAATRKAEALRALALAGVPPASACWLGAIDREASDHLAALSVALAALIAAVGPAAIVAHPYEGGHPDHDAAAFAVHAAARLHARAGHRAPAVVEMTSYHLAGAGIGTGSFLANGPPGAARALTADERDRKRRMLACHASQRATLAPFNVDEERFRRAPTYDFCRPPHPGPLYYEACGWASGERWRAGATAALARLGVEAPC